MAGKSRLELRVTAELKVQLRDRAAELGQDMSVFVTRALEAALSEAEGEVRERTGPTTGSVRPAASPRAFTPRPKGVK